MGQVIVMCGIEEVGIKKKVDAGLALGYSRGRLDTLCAQHATPWLRACSIDYGNMCPFNNRNLFNKYDPRLISRWIVSCR